MDQRESELVEKGLPCEECGSSDAAALYDDGHTYCFSCQHYQRGDQVTETSTKDRKAKRPFEDDLREMLDSSDIHRLDKWGITQATARHWDYRVRVMPDGSGQHLAIYRDDKGKPVFVKVRKVTANNPKVGFFGVGDESAVTLWGAEKLGNGGQMVVVCEGEKDTLAGSQLWNCKFPVVGLPFGAQSSAKAFAKALDKLSRYDKVVLALDMDGQGRDGAHELAAMLPPGKAYIADFPAKDLHETVVQSGADAAKRALFNAAPYRPDGIVDADELDAQLLEPVTWGWSLPYEFLTKWTYGMRPGGVWVIGAGTGVGKSDLAAEIVAHHIKPRADGGNEQRAAVFNYESGALQSLRLVLGKLWSKRFNIPDPEDGSPNIYWSVDDLQAARDYRREKCGKLFINDHKGAIDWASVKERIRYLKHTEDISLAVVDPVAALVATEQDERKALDLLFAEAKALAEELGITIIFVSHLARPAEGKSHEEGGRVTLRNFRGSGAIVMWASFVIALERNQQGDEEDRALTTCRMLKDRETGDATGLTESITYNTITGRLELAKLQMDQFNHDDEAVEEPAKLPVDEE